MEGPRVLMPGHTYRSYMSLFPLSFSYFTLSLTPIFLLYTKIYTALALLGVRSSNRRQIESDKHIPKLIPTPSRYGIASRRYSTAIEREAIHLISLFRSYPFP